MVSTFRGSGPSLVSRLNTGQRVELGEYDMRHFLATQLETE